jgi:hypothetical protein
MQESDQSCSFDVPETVQPFADAAAIAFERCYPEAKVSIEDSLVTILNAPLACRREFMHLLYREKTYQETLELRRILYARLGQ